MDIAALIIRFALVPLLFLSLSAGAASSYSAGFRADDAFFTPISAFGATRTAAAQALVAKLNALGYTGCGGAKYSISAPLYNSTSGYFDTVRSYPASSGCSAYSQPFSINPIASSVCDSSSTFSGGVCVCKTGYIVSSSGSNCVIADPRIPQCEVSRLGGVIPDSVDKAITVTSGSGLSACDGTCAFKGSASASDGGSTKIIYGPFEYTGDVCGSSGDAPLPLATTPVPPVCKKGTCPGTVNGASVCVACKSFEETSSKSASNSASNAASGAAATGTSSNIGSSSTTVCQAGSCTTTNTTVVNNSDGSKSEQKSTETQSQGDYCKKNPDATACADKQSSVFGTCSAVACTGDAIQCAIVKEQAKRNCQLMDTPTEISTVGTGIANGNTRPVDHPGNSGQTVNVAGTINTTNPFGSACPADLTFTTLGHTTTVPLSNACSVLQVMGYAAIAFTMFAGVRIAIGGIAS